VKNPITGMLKSAYASDKSSRFRGIPRYARCARNDHDGFAVQATIDPYMNCEKSFKNLSFLKIASPPTTARNDTLYCDLVHRKRSFTDILTISAR